MELSASWDADRPAARKRRVMDTSNRDARQAVQSVLTRFPAWRSDLSHFDARASRPVSEADRREILMRCRAMTGEILEARTELLAALADASQKVAGHSRVVDVERALDNVEAAIRNLHDRLSERTRADGFRPGRARPGFDPAARAHSEGHPARG